MSLPSDDSPVLDPEHLSRQTAGDAALERELLTLFEAQCEKLRPRLADGHPTAARADAAHTLKGSARAIGAWRLGAAADRLEAALRSGMPDPAAAGLMPALNEALRATRQAVAERLGTTAG
jgi:HPt (histidine-containing phosphotransfer) domain-containing protein